MVVKDHFALIQGLSMHWLQRLIDNHTFHHIKCIHIKFVQIVWLSMVMSLKCSSDLMNGMISAAKEVCEHTNDGGTWGKIEVIFLLRWSGEYKQGTSQMNSNLDQ